MSKIAITLPIRDYDHIAPLACGDVRAEGIELRLERDAPISRTVGDPSIQVGEISFARYLIRLAEGDPTFVGLPIFVARGFRHRDFYVLRDGGPTSMRELEGKRVGIPGWADTRVVWARAALRDQGVRIEQIEWWLGAVDTPSRDPADRGERHNLPSHVRRAPGGQRLLDLLLRGRLDALISPVPPAGFYQEGSPVARLIEDYRPVEQDYLRRTGVYPADHIIGIRRELFDRELWVAGEIYRVLEQSKLLAQKDRWPLADTNPWVLADIEETSELLGNRDWRPNGVAPNRSMIAVFCEEMRAQGLISEPLDPSKVFAEFESMPA